jgi:hypothetical protein
MKVLVQGLGTFEPDAYDVTFNISFAYSFRFETR